MPMYLGVWAWDYAAEYLPLEAATYGTTGRKLFTYRNRSGQGNMAGQDANLVGGKLVPPPTQAAANARTDITIFGDSQDLQATNDGHALNMSIQPKGGQGVLRMGIRYPDISAGDWDFSLIKMANECKGLPNQATVKHPCCFHLEANIQKGTPSPQPWNGAQGTDIASYANILGVSEAAAWAQVSADFRLAYAHVRDVFDAQGVTNLIWIVNITRTAYLGNFGPAAGWFPASSKFDWYSVDGYSPAGANSPADICDVPLAFAAAAGKKLWVFATGADEVPNTTYKEQWYLDWLAYLKANPAMAGLQIQHQGDSLNGVPRVWEVDSLPSGGGGDGRAVPHYTGSTFLNGFKVLANDPIFTGTPPSIKTFDVWETTFNRGFEVQQFIHPTHTRTAKTEFFLAGGEEELALTDVGPAVPYGTRHATPMVNMQTAKGTSGGQYAAFNLGWQNVVTDTTPGACTDPAGKAWPAWTETPQAYFKRQFSRGKVLPGAWLLVPHGNPENDLQAQKDSAIAQGLPSVTEATFCAFVAKLSQWADEVGVPNMVGIVLKLDIQTYLGTDIVSHDWSKWANVPSNAFDLFGAVLLNPFQTGGVWQSFSSMFTPVHQRVAALGKPLVLEAGTNYDPANLNRRATWFEEMRGILEGTTVAYMQTETDQSTGTTTTTPVTVGRLDIEAVLINTQGTMAPDQLAPPSQTTPDPATLSKLTDVLNDPTFVPGGVTTPSVTLFKSDSGKGHERVVLGKVVSAAVYDGGIYDGGTYDGSLTTLTEIFTEDSGVGTDIAQPVFGTPLSASDVGRGQDTAVLTTSTDTVLSVSDHGDGSDDVASLAKSGAITVLASDSGQGNDFASQPVVRLDSTPVVYDTLYFADERDPNYPWSPVQVGLDLNDNPTGIGFGWYYEAEIGMGDVPNTPDYVSEKPRPGADVAIAGLEVTQMTIPLTGSFATVDDLNTAYHRLARYAERGGIIVWKPRGQSAALYFHIDPSNIPALLDTSERVAHKVYGLRLIINMPLVLNRQPRVFRAPVIGAPVQMLMRSGVRHLRVFNPGNTTSLLRVKVQPQAGVSFPVQFRAGIYSESEGSLDDFEAMYSGELETADLRAQTTAVSEPKASGDLIAQTHLANPSDARMQRRWKLAIDNPAPGTYRLYVPVSVTQDCKLQLRYGLVAAAANVPAFYARDAVPLTPGPSIASSGDLTEIDLGLIRIPRGTRHVFLEGWAGLLDTDTPVGSGVNIRWDQYVLMPVASGFATVASPGFRIGNLARDSYSVDKGTLGRSGPGGFGDVQLDDSGSAWTLNDNDEIAFTKPLSGNELDPGRHRITFHGWLHDQDHDDGVVAYPPGRPLVHLEVWDVTKYPGINLVSPSASQRSEVSVEMFTKRSRITTEFSKTLEFQTTPGHVYTAVARYDRAANSGRWARIDVFTDSVLSTTTYPSMMVLDGWERDASIRTPAAERLWALTTDGFLDAPPGWFDLVMSFSEVPFGNATLDATDYSTLDDREPLGRVDTDFLYAVSLELVPAFVAQ